MISRITYIVNPNLFDWILSCNLSKKLISIIDQGIDENLELVYYTCQREAKGDGVCQVFWVDITETGRHCRWYPMTSVSQDYDMDKDEEES